jgi:ornithine cyclodeaminase/alanine dehydrogenase-like protein (mu-crystallin family)
VIEGQQIELNIHSAYEFFEAEYRAAFTTWESRQLYNPSKLTQVMKKNVETNEPISSCSVMWGRLPISGYFGTKTIYYSYDIPLKRSSRTVLFDSTGDVAGIYDANVLTAIRCGLLAILAIKQTGKVITKDSTVGLVGFGKINSMVGRVLKAYYNIAGYVIRDPKCNAMSAEHWMPSNTRFESLNTPSKLLKECDIIVTATTNSDLENALGLEDVTNGGKRLIICLDLGWLLKNGLNPHISCCTDHPEQLIEHWKEEFPWDPVGMHLPPMVPGQCPKFDQTSTKQTIISYIYGIAVADIAIAAYLHSQELANEG